MMEEKDKNTTLDQFAVYAADVGKSPNSLSFLPSFPSRNDGEKIG